MPPLTEEDLRKIYEKERQDYLKTAITISKPELDTATENADTKNEKIITDFIDPTPGLFDDDTIDFND